MDTRCRDDVPAGLQGIQYIYCKEELRQEIFTLLENHILEKLDPAGDSPEAGRINRAVGCRGMDLWNILVLGLLKQGVNCDYDRLHDLANRHLDVRRMLGLSEVFDSTTYSYRTQLLRCRICRNLNCPPSRSHFNVEWKRFGGYSELGITNHVGTNMIRTR